MKVFSAKPAFSSGLHPAALIILYIAMALMPLVLSAIPGLPVRGFWRELSAGLVMVGYTMLLMQFLLSGRFRTLSGRVGIDLTMHFHQLIALTVLTFILVHPLLYMVPRLGSDPAAGLTSLLHMMMAPPLRSGSLAWLLLLLLVPLALLRDRLPIRYELWRLLHGLGAGVIAGLGLHHTLQAGTYSGATVVAAWWVLLSGLAILSLTYVYLFRPLAQLRRPWRVVGNRQVAEGTWEITLAPAGHHCLTYDAGQFVWLNLGHSPFSLTEHPFSLSSAPRDGARLAFTIKQGGDFTNHIGELPEGTRAYLDGPHGAFTLRGCSGRPLVFIAGGVGLAPIIGMLRQLADEHSRLPVHLIYGNRIESQILYRDEIEAMQHQLDLRVDLVLSEPSPSWRGRSGQLTHDMIATCLDEPPPDALYFVCGPVPMMVQVERTLAAMGVPATAIKSERFRYN